jgi:hypothetical protein
MPIFFLYFNEQFTVGKVLLLESIYYATVVIVEVPSGYFSDRVGRKATLLISAAALLVSYLLFTVSEPFWMFVVAQMLLAVGIAFNSGTDTSFHYDSLESCGRSDEYADREAIVARNGLLASGLAALIGGAAGLIDMRLAYVISAIAALICLSIVLKFVEPAIKKHGVRGDPFTKQLKYCVNLLRSPALAWLFGFAVLMTVLNHVPYEFYQPYIDFAIEAARTGEESTGHMNPGNIESASVADGIKSFDKTSDAFSASSTPLVTGIHSAAAMLLGALVAGISVKLSKRMGVAFALLLAATVQAAVIALMGWMLSLWIVPLILMRVMPRALMTAPLNAAIAPRIDQRHRATYLSIQSLAGRLSFSAVLFGMSFLATGEEDAAAVADWASVSSMLKMALVIAVVGILVLAATSPVLKARQTF